MSVTYRYEKKRSLDGEGLARGPGRGSSVPVWVKETKPLSVGKPVESFLGVGHLAFSTLFSGLCGCITLLGLLFLNLISSGLQEDHRSHDCGVHGFKL